MNQQKIIDKTNRKGRKSSMQNAQLLSVYINDFTMNKLEIISKRTLANKSAIARDILTKQLELIEVT